MSTTTVNDRIATYHCNCCHGQFGYNTDAASWVSDLDSDFEWDESIAYCGTCNADGCSPACYAFDVVPGFLCKVCDGPLTKAHLWYTPVRMDLRPDPVTS